MLDEELDTFSTETDAESVTDEEIEGLTLVEVAAGEDWGAPEPLLEVETGALEPDREMELLAADEAEDPLLADGEGALDPNGDTEVVVIAAERKVVKLDTVEEERISDPLLWPDDEEDEEGPGLVDLEVVDVVTPDEKSSSVIDENEIEEGPALGERVPEDTECGIGTAEDTDGPAKDDVNLDDGAIIDETIDEAIDGIIDEIIDETIEEAIDEDVVRVELIPVEFAMPLRDVENEASPIGSVG
ncbi:MAG: hypothetical protein TREMPRED_003426 [Tremellales sp. Tagirdzhanova-0007]|nr:MAG: hypothetical protein TREMPRED_003426 [Tremellales sp. Tagirdzhanova-0007]